MRLTAFKPPSLVILSVCEPLFRVTLLRFTQLKPFRTDEAVLIVMVVVIYSSIENVIFPPSGLNNNLNQIEYSADLSISTGKSKDAPTFVV